MNAQRLVLLIGLVGLLAIVAGTTILPNVARPSAEGAVVVKKESVLEFGLATGDPDFDLLRAVAVIRGAAKIGSSDPDGYAIDSFFDIEYRIDISTPNDGSAPTPTHTLKVEMHAMPNSPAADPAVVIDRVEKELDKTYPAKRKEFTGHVTLMK